MLNLRVVACECMVELLVIETRVQPYKAMQATWYLYYIIEQKLQFRQYDV